MQTIKIKAKMQESQILTPMKKNQLSLANSRLTMLKRMRNS